MSDNGTADETQMFSPDDLVRMGRVVEGLGREEMELKRAEAETQKKQRALLRRICSDCTLRQRIDLDSIVEVKWRYHSSGRVLRLHDSHGAAVDLRIGDSMDSYEMSIASAKACDGPAPAGILRRPACQATCLSFRRVSPAQLSFERWLDEAVRTAGAAAHGDEPDADVPFRRR